VSLPLLSLSLPPSRLRLWLLEVESLSLALPEALLPPPLPLLVAMAVVVVVVPPLLSLPLSPFLVPLFLRRSAKFTRSWAQSTVNDGVVLLEAYMFAPTDRTTD
jgi:hypothetical protein